MNRSAAHTALCRAILADIGALPGVVIGTNETGMARYISTTNGKEFCVPYGWPSHDDGPDLIAVVAPRARMVALEVKTGKAVASAGQKAILKALAAVGAVTRVCRCVEDARGAIEEARR